METTRLLKERFQCETVRKIRNNQTAKQRYHQGGKYLVTGNCGKECNRNTWGLEVKDPADEQEVFTCLNCGKNIDIDIQKDAKNRLSGFFCKECRDKRQRPKRLPQKKLLRV